MIICNLKSQSTARDYIVIDASFGYASVELRNPSSSENPTAFDVEAVEVCNVRVIGDDGEITECPDYLRCERRQSDGYEAEFYYPGVLM